MIRRNRRWVGVVMFLAGYAWTHGQTLFVDEKMKSQVPPPHPTVIFTEYNKKMHPIVGVRRELPEIEWEGKLKTTSLSRATYVPERGVAFAPGSVSVQAQRANADKTTLVLMTERGDVNGGTLDEHSDYEATFLPHASYKNCYLAVLFVDASVMDGAAEKGSVIVIFRELKDFVAEQPQKVSVRFGYLGEGMKNKTFFPLLFTAGIEIRSNLSDVAARFFRRMELRRHERMLAAYLNTNAGKDHPLEPYFQLPPSFSEQVDLASPDTPKSVNTSFMVNEDGTVYSVQFEGQLPPSLRQELTETLNGWLFLPRIKQGSAVRTMVRMPIQISSSKAAP